MSHSPPRTGAPAGQVSIRTPEISYLAKDYESFRRQMLDHMSLLIPEWTERNPADIGVAIIEVLAYAADYLSYYQDAVATEAYLGSARRRISVKRHARYLDYRLHEGCNARVWVCVTLKPRTHLQPGTGAEGGGDAIWLPRRSQLLTRLGDAPAVLDMRAAGYGHCLEQAPGVFETLYDAPLYESHNELRFYARGTQTLTLPRGATSAVLAGHQDRLHRGDVLLLEQTRGRAPGRTGEPDPRFRHVVRVSSEPRRVTDPAGGGAPITEIEWFREDALPFALPVVARAGGVLIRDLAVARGNLVLADQGQPGEELLPRVRSDQPYRPRLGASGLTMREAFDPEAARRRPAGQAVYQDPVKALPALRLQEFDLAHLAARREARAGSRRLWRARMDLLNSDRFAEDFVVEMEQGVAHLRFGDNIFGRRPVPGSRFRALYREGNGPAGNIMPETLCHLATARPELLATVKAVRNPTAGAGGRDPELQTVAQRFAPVAFRVQERCVIPADYEASVKRHPSVRGAAVITRWSGSWVTAFVYVQQAGGWDLDAALRRELEALLQPRLVAGHRLVLRAPVPAPLQIVLSVSLHHGASEVATDRALQAALGAGPSGFFYADNFTFGQPVALDDVLAAAARVDGVRGVHATRFRRQGRPQSATLGSGRIDVGPTEIVSVHNAPLAPQFGTIHFSFRHSQ